MEEKTLRFGLNSIKQKSSYLNSLDSLNITDFDINNVRLGKGYNLDFNPETGIFNIITSIDFGIPEGEKSNKIAKLFGVKVEVGFRLHDYEGIVKKVDENTIDAPDQLLVNLISVAYSTARGVLFCHTSKSDYEGMYLPLTDPDEFRETLFKAKE